MTINGNSKHHETERASLAARQIPHMVLSDATQAAPPEKVNASPEQRAQQRFAVSGNAIVTGGAGTLGLEACTALLEHGLSGLVIFDMSQAQNNKAVKLLQSRFPDRVILSAVVDVTNESAVEAAVRQAAAQLGTLDHLLCFSGIVNCAHALDVSGLEWRRVLDVNTTGSFLCAQHVARVMQSQSQSAASSSATGGGYSITFTASISAHRVNYPQPQAAYNVSKAGLITLKNCLAAEWARYGIRVNSISPGYMDTILNEGDGLAEARATWTGRNPTGRLGRPAELTGAVVLLASHAGSYINGADIVVDGGGIVF